MSDVKVGAVVVFRDGVTMQEVVNLLAQEGLAERIEGANVNEFNPDWGSPVWYVP